MNPATDERCPYLPSLRLILTLCAMLLFSARLLAGSDSLDSLPTAVQNTLKALLQDPKDAVGGVEIGQWGVGLAYKVIITRDGHPYLEAHVGESGQLVGCDPIPQTAAADNNGKDRNKEDGSGNDDQASLSPRP